MPSPDAPLSPVAHYALLSSLNPRRRRRGPLAEFWEQAERLNLVAYRLWDDAQPGDEVRSEPDTVNAGCQFWSKQVYQLVALLRALPYPEVAMSLLPPDLLLRLGNELNDLVGDGSVPVFVHAEDPVEARRQWVRLVALVAVSSNDELNDLRSVLWLREHAEETIAALHDVRLFDWTVVAKLARMSVSLPSTTSSAPAQSAGPRV